MANSSAETENRAVNALQNDEIRQEEQRTPSVEQDLQRNDEIRLTDNVNKGMIKQKTAYCAYIPCGKEFVRTVSWKKFCCDDCRKADWETKHGKKLNLKREAKNERDS